jgi:putative membrane protein
MKKIVMNTMLAAALCFGFAACDSGQRAANEAENDTEAVIADAETAASTDANTDKNAMDKAEDANERKIENNNATTGSASDDKEDDAEFMMKAAASGMFEVQAAELALQKASSKSVKDFARKMKEDHSKANKELKALAAKKNITLPTSLDKDYLDKIEDLREESGADFDSEYMQVMHKAHEKDVKLFEEMAKEDDADGEIKAFAAKTLPVLQSHHHMAETKKEVAKEMDMDTIGIPKSKRNN